MTQLEMPARAAELPRGSVALVLSGTEHQNLRVGVVLWGVAIFGTGVLVGVLWQRHRKTKRVS